MQKEGREKEKKTMAWKEGKKTLVLSLFSFSLFLLSLHILLAKTKPTSIEGRNITLVSFLLLIFFLVPFFPSPSYLKPRKQWREDGLLRLPGASLASPRERRPPRQERWPRLLRRRRRCRRRRLLAHLGACLALARPTSRRRTVSFNRRRCF